MRRSDPRPASRPRAATRRRRASSVAALLVLCAVVAAAGQGFDAPPSFGETEQAREYVAVEPSGLARGGYFIHNQPVKIAIVGGLSLLALGVLGARGGRFRRWLLLVPIGLVGFYLGGVLCPLASVQNIFLKWDTGYMLLFLIPVVLALGVGRVFCGYVCPFGAVQELLHVKRWELRIPPRLRRTLGMIKYIVLVYLVVRVIGTGTGIWQGLTPFKALFEWGGTPLAIALTAAFAALSLILWRPFCEAFCPLGALLSILSRWSLFHLRSTNRCVSCGRCEAVCPTSACVNGEIDVSRCFLCGRCVRACPIGGLRLAPRWRAATRPSGEHVVREDGAVRAPLDPVETPSPACRIDCSEDPNKP